MPGTAREWVGRLVWSDAPGTALPAHGLGSCVNLHAQVLGYRLSLRFCAYLSTTRLIVSFFIHWRKEVSVFDSS